MDLGTTKQSRCDVVFDVSCRYQGSVGTDMSVRHTLLGDKENHFCQSAGVVLYSTQSTAVRPRLYVARGTDESWRHATAAQAWSAVMCWHVDVLCDARGG
jgi:hypothetical protein